MMAAFICGPRIYQFEGWTFEFPAYSGPWPLRKDGELRARAGRKFWAMFKRFEALPESEQAACSIGGGCMRIEL